MKSVRINQTDTKILIFLSITSVVERFVLAQKKKKMDARIYMIFFMIMVSLKLNYCLEEQLLRAERSGVVFEDRPPERDVLDSIPI